MKRLTRLLALLLLLVCCVNAACAVEPMITWNGDESTPTRLVHAGDHWYATLGSYGRADATLAIGPSPDKLVPVYSADARVWGTLAATPEYAAWVQEQNDTLTWMLHNRESGETVAVHTEPFGDERPCFGVVLDANAMYYVRSDTAAGTAELVRRSHADGAETILHAPGCPISSLTIRQGELVLAQLAEAGWQILRMDAENCDMIAMKQLPADVEMVFTVDYDPATGGYAVYYCDDSGREHAGAYVGVRLHSIFTFGSRSYAYEDAMVLQDGHLIWTIKHEVSGLIADNFRVVDVNMLTGDISEYERSMHFIIDGGKLLLLTINPDKELIVLETAR